MDYNLFSARIAQANFVEKVARAGRPYPVQCRDVECGVARQRVAEPRVAPLAGAPERWQ